MKRAVFAGVLAVGVVLTGCSQSTPPPTQFSTVTMSPAAVTPSVASPSASGSGSAGTSSTPDPAKVAEAERIFREYQTAFFAAQVAGGSASLPADMAALSAPPISVDAQQLLAKQELDGARPASEPEPSVTFRGPLAGISRGGSELTLSACVDSTRIPILKNGKKISMGVAVEYRAYFKTFEGVLKYFDAENKTVRSC